MGRGVAHRGAGCAVPPPGGGLWLRFVWGWLWWRGGALCHPPTPLPFPFPAAHWEAGGGWGWPLRGEASSRAAAGLASFAGVFG